MTDRRPVLVIGYGNPGRGDDGAGPALVERLEALRDRGELADVFDTVTDYQLQIELAEDLNGRELVIFADAAEGLEAPFEIRPVSARRDRSYTSHELTPAALLDVQRRAFGCNPAASLVIAIAGSRFELGQPAAATRDIELATAAAAEKIRAAAAKRVVSPLQTP